MSLFSSRAKPTRQPGGGDVLARRLGVFDAIVIGLGSMIGAGIFASLAPAARSAGSGLLLALVVAAVVAYCNASSSARLAALYPASGGTYVYGRERLGPFWGYLAGWSFVIGKTASCAAMALTVGFYVWPDHARLIAVAAVIALTAINLAGISKSAHLAAAIVTITLVVLAALVIVSVTGGDGRLANLELHADIGPYGILQAAGLLFFAFAGYARIATLGEEVRDPARTIPRAIPAALGITLVVYAAVAVAALAVLGPAGLAATDAPLAELARITGGASLQSAVRVAAAVASLGSLLALILGVSRTTLAMARDRRLPGALATVHPSTGSPYLAQIAVGVVVIALAATVDLRGVIGFSSFGVLVYYAIANASAWTLDARRLSRVIPVLGLAGCLAIAASMPLASVLAGIVVTAVGIAVYWLGPKVRTSPDA